MENPTSMPTTTQACRRFLNGVSGTTVALCLLCSCTSDRSGGEHASITVGASGSGAAIRSARNGGPTAASGHIGAERDAGSSNGDSDRPKASSLLPARIRRLANAEYDATVHKLLSTRMAPGPAADFPPDFRQGGFTVNDAQRIDPVIVERVARAADSLATEALQNGTLARLAPCRDLSAAARRCARAFIQSFGAKMYRRPLVRDEVQALLALYDVGADGATYPDGIAHVLRGLLQSAGFLYLTELGDAAPPVDGAIALSPYEVASSLSYFLTSAPPDDELLAKAASGALSDPAEREAQARRLFEREPLAQENTVRLVREWLGIDRIDQSAKDSLVYPEFEAQKAAIVAESKDFVRAVAFRASGTVSELLGARWTVDSGPLTLYRQDGEGPIPGSSELLDRVGILNQAAFLASYANAHESHPVFRGVAVARRVACIKLDSPTAFDIIVVPPVPDPKKTTRERFDVHSKDALCQTCHSTIDPFGFSFEHFDGMGGFRNRENGRPVVSKVLVNEHRDFDGAFVDSNQLASALATSKSARVCFARFMFRAGAATGSLASTQPEAEFLDSWEAMPAAAQGNIVETLIAFVKRPTFTWRRAE
jgi:hypothetical protein